MSWTLFANSGDDRIPNFDPEITHELMEFVE
jgi:hypothetical protein